MNAELISETKAQPLVERGGNRSRRPDSAEFRAFMTKDWNEEVAESPQPGYEAMHAARRRLRLSKQFEGWRLMIPSGPSKTRAGDSDYRFRAHSAFVHLTGLGAASEPDSVLVLDPVGRGKGDHGGHHQAMLYIRPSSNPGSEGFYSDETFGGFWVGARPPLAAVQAKTGITTTDLARLDLNSQPTPISHLAGVDPRVDALVDSARGASDGHPAWNKMDDKLGEALSELRLIKDPWEIEQIRQAVAITVQGFNDVVAALPKALQHPRGERVVETVFAARARREGNDVGYETVAAAGSNATTLHWMANDGAVKAGQLLLLDAGAETDSLYTADITRTLPANGRFTPIQRRVYEAVLEAADAAFAAAAPGRRFRDIHDAAMDVLAARMEDWGILPVPATEALMPAGQHHRRWMPHGTSHHLGLDVHDCAQARRELYLDAQLSPGMVFTIEPGLYFKSEDAAVPPEFRGIGVRIEDDIVMTEQGPVNLSATLPRHPDDVEAWVRSLGPVPLHKEAKFLRTNPSNELFWSND